MTYHIQPDVVLATICEETFLIAAGEARGKAPYIKGITGPGVYFWKMLEQQMPLEDIIRQAAKDYSVSEEDATEGFWDFFNVLKEDGYIIVSEASE